MFQPKLARWLAVSTGLLALTVAAQTAQPAPGASRPAPAASAEITPSASASSPAHMQTAPSKYRSAFEGYQPYSETKIVPWKAANDRVGQIGGWRAYAKEAAEGQVQGSPQGYPGHPPAASAPKPAASQAKP